MNVGSGPGYESYFGPASEVVDVAQFLSSTSQFQHGSSFTGSSASQPSPQAVQHKWSALADETKKEIETECRYVFCYEIPTPFVWFRRQYFEDDADHLQC